MKDFKIIYINAGRREERYFSSDLGTAIRFYEVFKVVCKMDKYPEQILDNNEIITESPSKISRLELRRTK